MGISSSGPMWPKFPSARPNHHAIQRVAGVDRPRPVLCSILTHTPYRNVCRRQKSHRRGLAMVAMERHLDLESTIIHFTHTHTLIRPQRAKPSASALASFGTASRASALALVQSLEVLCLPLIFSRILDPVQAFRAIRICARILATHLSCSRLPTRPLRFERRPLRTRMSIALTVPQGLVHRAVAERRRATCVSTQHPTGQLENG